MAEADAEAMQALMNQMVAMETSSNHGRSSSWDNDVSDVMKRRLQENIGVNIDTAIKDMDMNNVELVENADDEALEELQDIHAEKELIEKAFAKIDEDNNEDIECEEFVEGLKKLKVNLTDKEMEKVFNLMDFDKSNYIDRNEFSMFLTQRYESKQLARMQDAILLAIRGGNKHNRKPSGMELRDQQRMMKKQMTMIFQDEAKKVTEEQKMLDSLEAEKKEKGDEFCNEKKANEWNSFEVADWLTTLEMDEYQVNFLKNKVNGSQLLFDFNEQSLQFTLGVKKVHVSKLLRGIQQLKDKCRTEWDEEIFETADYTCNPMESAANRFIDYEERIAEQEQEMQELKKEYEGRIKKLLQEISEKDEIIKECEKQGFLRNAEDEGSLLGSTDDDMPPLEPAQNDISTEDAYNQEILMQATQAIDDDDDDYDNDTKKENESTNENDDQNDDDNEDDDNDDNTQTTKHKQSSSVMIKNDDVEKIKNDVDDDLKKHEPTQIPKSMVKKTHHRKRTSIGGGRRRPPAGTQAYWLWLNEKKQLNPNFGSKSHALQWTHHEIALWMKSIKCEKYCKQFVEEKITGEALLHDIDSLVLTKELGVKMLHAGKIKREIDKLKYTIGVGFQLSNPEHIQYKPKVSNVEKNKELETKLNEMELEYKKNTEELETEHESKLNELKTENEKLITEVKKLEEKIIELEKRKFTEEEEFDEAILTNDDNKENIRVAKRYKTKKVRSLMEEVKVLSEANENYGNANNALNWGYKEVCFWLDGIDMPLYIKSFMEQKIDGEILIKDLDKVILHDELNVKRFHCGKILREISKLRLNTDQGLVISNPSNIGYNPEFSARDMLTEMKLENEKLSQSISELKDKPSCGEDELILKKETYESILNEKKRLDEYVDKLEKEKEENKPELEKQKDLENMNKIINELKNKKDENKEFAEYENADKWNNNEVCYWLVNIGLHEYIENFKKGNITGSVIVQDLNAGLLSSELGVKRLHINQILRESEKLKSAVNGLVIDTCESMSINYEPRKRAVELINEYDSKIKELNEMITEKNGIISTKEEIIINEENKYKTLFEQKTNLEDNIEQLAGTISKMKLDNEQKMEENAKNTINELESKINDLNQLIKENEEKYESDRKDLETEKNEELTKLKSELEDLQKQYDQVSERLNIFEEKERENNEANKNYEESFEYQLKKKAEEDSTFGQPKLALKWTIEEVCYWLYSIRQPEYVDSFRELLVDGGMLLSDLSVDQLRTELGIKKHHLGKIKREIEKLKNLAQSILIVSEFDDVKYVPKIENLPQLVDELKHQLEQQKNINDALTLEIDNLNNVIVKIKNQKSNDNADNDDDTNESKEISNSIEIDTSPKINNKNQSNSIKNNNNNNNITSDINIKEYELKITILENEIQRITKEKITVVETTAREMNRLRKMLNIMSTAYEQLSGTPLGSVAQNPSVENFFKMVGYGKKQKNNKKNNQYPRRYDF